MACEPLNLVGPGTYKVLFLFVLNVQVSDTTTDAQRYNAGYIKNYTASTSFT